MTAGANASYELGKAATAASVTAHQLLPPIVARLVASEITWLRNSPWASSKDRLVLLVAEVNTLASERSESAA
jgi:hypothetical protein